MWGRKVGAVCAVALCMAATGASAGVVSYTDRGAFNAAANPNGSEDFNSYVNDVSFNTSPVTVGPMTFSIANETTEDGYNKIDAPPLEGSEGDVDGTTDVYVLTLNSDVSVGGSMTITFSTPITAFGADFAQFNDDEQRTTILIDSIATLTPPVTSEQTNFYGFVSDIPFTTITFYASDGPDGFGIDNVAYTVPSSSNPIPEPATLVLLGAGLAGLGARRSRRKPA